MSPTIFIFRPAALAASFLRQIREVAGFPSRIPDELSGIFQRHPPRTSVNGTDVDATAVARDQPSGLVTGRAIGPGQIPWCGLQRQATIGRYRWRVDGIT